MRLVGVTVRNYKSVKELVLRVGSFTVLVGRSDQGKSAIIQAIRDALTNPAGKAMVTIGESRMQTGLLFDTGDRIIYDKGKSPGFKLTIGGKDIRYDKVGRAIPEEVEEIARRWSAEGMKPTVICVQEQQETPFLLGVSRAAGSRALDVLDMRIYSTAHTSCQSAVRKLKRELSVVSSEEADWEARLDVLEQVKGLQQTRREALEKKEAISKLLMSSLAEKVPQTDRAAAMLRAAALEETPEVKTTEKAVPALRALALQQLPAPPDTKKLEAMVRVLELSEQLETAVAQLQKEDFPGRIKEIDQEIFESGACPLCGAEVKDADHHCK